MERTWTKIGAECMGLDLEAEVGRIPALTRARVLKAIKKLKWQAIPCELGFMPGESIKATIAEFRLRATHVAVSHELAPYGFYGIRSRYKGGYGELFVLDTGTGITPLVTDFYREEVA